MSIIPEGFYPFPMTEEIIIDEADILHRISENYLNPIQEAEMIEGYHTKPILKGVLGDSSKIREELEELEDAEAQHNKIMALVELSDLYGAMLLYLEKHYPGISISDVAAMASATQRAFESGRRK